ncbi:probable glyco hormone G- coupled receptor [Paramuricea clavata]|nr:probable glyco hormone G- coupled receptor [Paramuricea clavata]
MKKIKILEMSNNPIESIASHAFEKLVSLKTLYLDGIDIENLPTVGLQNLITLSLDRVHKLRTIPEGLERIENVKLAKEKSFLCCKLKFDRIGPHLTGPRTKFNGTTRSMPTTPTNRATRSESATPAGFGKRKKRRSILTLSPSAAPPTGPINTVPPSRPLNCTPEPTAFQPCEDVMGADWLTAVSFIIAPFALCGNFVVLVVFLCLARNYNVSRFLVTNLALADLSMGVYLLSLVIESVITSGEYYKHVERFQFGLSCNVLGFLAMFSSELSVFSLTMITVERYLTIVYAMYPRYRLTMRTAIICMIIGWIVAITVAVLPIRGVGSYGKVAICLPFDTDNGGDLYLFFVFGLNGVGFLFVCALYAQIYRSVFRTNNSTPTRGHDSRVARRMALLVFTDFACFTPIAITGISALLGNPLIDVKQSKYLLVFFFPLNGLLNPFLYAIITKTFRRDLAALLKNCFVCGGTLTNYISNFPGSRSVQSTNDVLNPSARPSLDFNAMGGFHSLGNIRGSRENPVSASFSKSEPNLVKFNDEALNS